jgi:hypothetical protein
MALFWCAPRPPCLRPAEYMLIYPQTFWLFQTYLHDLASAPSSIAFKTCRRIYNRVQRIVFGSADMS